MESRVLLDCEIVDARWESCFAIVTGIMFLNFFLKIERLGWKIMVDNREGL